MGEGEGGTERSNTSINKRITMTFFPLDRMKQSLERETKVQSACCTSFVSFLPFSVCVCLQLAFNLLIIHVLGIPFILCTGIYALTHSCVWRQPGQFYQTNLAVRIPVKTSLIVAAAAVAYTNNSNHIEIFIRTLNGQPLQRNSFSIEFYKFSSNVT